MTLANPQRRGAQRDFLSIPVAIFGELFAAPVAVDSANFSPQGVFLTTELLLEPGDLVIVRFNLPGTRHEVTADGRVVRACRDRHAGIGVEFGKLPRIDHELMRAALARHRLRSAPDPRNDAAFRC